GVDLLPGDGREVGHRAVEVTLADPLAVHDGRRPGVGAATAERECRHQPGCRDAAAQPRRSHRVTSLVTPAARRPRPSYGSAGGSAEVVVGRAAALAEEVAGAAPATGVG